LSEKMPPVRARSNGASEGVNEVATPSGVRSPSQTSGVQKNGESNFPPQTVQGTSGGLGGTGGGGVPGIGAAATFV
jgi:hypothetical protein